MTELVVSFCKGGKRSKQNVTNSIKVQVFASRFVFQENGLINHFSYVFYHTASYTTFTEIYNLVLSWLLMLNASILPCHVPCILFFVL